MFSNNTHGTDLIGPGYDTNDSCSVVEYRGSVAEEYYNTRGSVVEYRGSVAQYYNSREYGGSTGTRHCRRLAREQQAEVTTSNIIHLHPKEHVEFGGHRTDHIPQKSNNHRHNVDNTFYFNQRGRYSVYVSVTCLSMIYKL